MPSSLSGLAIGAALRKKAKKYTGKMPALDKSQRMFQMPGVTTERERKLLEGLPKRYTVKQMLERARRNATGG